MELIQTILDSLSGAQEVGMHVQKTMQSFLAVITIPMLINCFFGYKIQKIMITIGGAAVGALLGGMIGVLLQQEALMIAAIIGMALLGGFLAFKLYRLGIFLLYWALGSIFFAAVMIACNGYEAIGFSIVLGLIVGVLALVLQKTFIICATAVSGGVTAGIALGNIAEADSVSGIIIGIILAVLGIFVQSKLNKKTQNKTAQNAGPIVQPAGAEVIEDKTHKPGEISSRVTAFSIGRENRSSDNSSELLNAEAINLSRIIETVPETYCPKSGVVIESIQLDKDDTGNTYLSVYFNNIRITDLAAVYFKITGYGMAGECLGEETYSKIDMNLQPAQSFECCNIKLFDSNIRRVDVQLTSIADKSYNVIKCESEDYVTLPRQTEIRSVLNSELEDALELTPDEKYFYQELNDGLWMCTCGHIGYNSCPHCGRDKGRSLRNSDKSILERLSDTVEDIRVKSDKITTDKQAGEYKEKIIRIKNVISENGFSSDLTEKCNELVLILDGKAEGIRQKKDKAAENRKKLAIFAAAVIAFVAVITVAVNVIIGLAPGKARIKNDIQNYLITRYPDHDIKLKKTTADSKDVTAGYCSAAWTVDYTNEYKDIINCRVHLYYEKPGKKYELANIDTSDKHVQLNHDSYEDDEFMAPHAVLNFNDTERYECTDTYAKTEKIETKYNLDFDRAVVEGSTMTVPVEIDVIYCNSHGHGTYDVEYEYNGFKFWLTSVDCYIDMIPNDNIIDASNIDEVLSRPGEAITYNEESFPLNLFRITNSEFVYHEGFSSLSIFADAVLDNGFSRIEGRSTINMHYTGDKWVMDEAVLKSGEGLVQYRSVPDSVALAKAKEAAMARLQTITNDNFEDAVITEKTDENVFCKLYYITENESFIDRNVVEVCLNSDIVDLYDVKSVSSPTIESSTLKEEISKSVTVTHQLNCSGTVPKGILANGESTLKVDVYKDLTAKLSGSIGGMEILLNGYMDRNSGEVVFNDSFSREINVSYHLIFFLNGNITFDALSNLKYDEKELLTGSISFSAKAAGVDGFNVIITDAREE